MDGILYKQRGAIGEILQLCLVVMSFFTVFWLLISPDYSGKYYYMFLLPLGHCFLCIVCFDLFYKIEKSIGRLILLAGYTIRNVITPLFLCLGNYEITTIPTVSKESILWATVVMLYETVVVFVYLNYYTKKHKNDCVILAPSQNNENKFSLYSLISLGITLIMLLALYMVPGIMSSYKNFWTTDESVIIQVFSTIQDYSSGSVERLLYAFFSMFFSIMQIIWSIKLIELIRTIFNQRIIGVILSFGVILLNTFWVSETSAYTVFVIVVLGLNVLKLYPKKKNFIIVATILGVAVILALMIIMRANTYDTGVDNVYGKLATFLNAYFPGVANVSVVQNLKVPSLFVTLYYDFYKGIPLQSLIPPIMEGQRLSEYFNAAINSTSQILPLTGQTVFYLGLLGPIVQVIIATLVMKCEKYAKKSKNNIEYLAYTTGVVILAAGCTMYDVTILVAFALKTIIPFILLAQCMKIRFKFR